MKAYVDLETCSELDLRKVGSFRYFEHPSTQVICMSWAIGDGPISTWVPCRGQEFPDELREWIASHGDVSGWNIGNFEEIAFRTANLGLPAVTPSQWHCSMTRAAYWGLPLALDMAGPALDLSVHKDKDGHRLMMQMSKPRKNGTWWHLTDPAKLDRLIQYCERDVEVEREVDRSVPDLPPSERLVWTLDRRMNAAGLKVDRPLLVRAARLASDEMQALADRMKLNYGFGPSEVAKMLAFVNTELAQVNGQAVPDLRAETVAQWLTYSLPAPVRDVLEIRQEFAKSSVAKLERISAAIMVDGRVRGLTQYYGASRTGRFAGRLVQFQNLPRPMKGLNIKAAVQDILGAQFPNDIADVVRDFHGRPLDVVSSLIRSLFVPADGMKFIVGDFSQIEARVVCWLAGQQDMLEVFASGQDPYVYAAERSGHPDPKGSGRQYGKVQVLALGFGMGADRFVDAAAKYGLTLSLQEAERAVDGWRQANARIVAFWWNLDRAVKQTLQDGKIRKVGYITVGMGKGKLDGCLLLKLPSKRYLVYRNARVFQNAGREEIHFDGVDQYTKQWGTQRTYGGKLVENVTQAVARDVMCEALDTLGRVKFLRPLTTVHDEIICEANASTAASACDFMEGVMTRRPVWAPTLPVAADVKVMDRYGK